MRNTVVNPMTMKPLYATVNILFHFTFLGIDVGVAILRPTRIVACCRHCDFIGKLCHESIYRCDFLAIKLVPYHLHMLLKTREFCKLLNPVIAKRRIDVDKSVFAIVERVAKVPYRTKHPFLILATIAVHVATAVERLSVLHYLLYDVETHQAIHIDEFFPIGR